MSFFGVMVRSNIQQEFTTRTLSGMMQKLNFPYDPQYGRIPPGYAPGVVTFRDEATRDRFAEELASMFPGVQVESFNVVAVRQGAPAAVVTSAVSARGVLPA